MIPSRQAMVRFLVHLDIISTGHLDIILPDIKSQLVLLLKQFAQVSAKLSLDSIPAVFLRIQYVLFSALGH